MITAGLTPIGVIPALEKNGRPTHDRQAKTQN